MEENICFSLLCWAGCVSAHAGGEPATIFLIGVPDGDYREFATAGNYATYSKLFTHDVNFVAGQSDPGRDWPYIQPGPADAWAGSKPHTFTIHFQIPEPGSNYYRLVIDFVGAHYSDPPRLTVDINGERLDRRLPAGRNDGALTYPKSGKNYSLRQFLPSTLLHAGGNIVGRLRS